jgi:hypothetical protein
MPPLAEEKLGEREPLLGQPIGSPARRQRLYGQAY